MDTLLAVGAADQDETWVLDGLDWQRRTPSVKPSPRADAGIAYDAARDRTVLFGGRSGGACGTELADTWQWNGSTWTPQAPVNSPPPAGGVGLVYDSQREVCWTLVGSEMWSYDGTDWTGPYVPPATFYSSFAYDSARDRVLVAGGQTAGAPAIANAWEWDGQRWYVLPDMPTARTYAGMFYDPSIQRCVVSGGHPGDNVPLPGTLLWDGAGWSSSASSISPLRFGAAAAYVPDAANPSNAFGIAIGGTVNGNGISVSDVDTWDGAAWNTAPSLSQRLQPSACYDPARDELIVFGGMPGENSPTVTFADTWRFSSNTWTQLTPANSPPKRYSAGLAHDPVSQNLILFGGWVRNDGSNPFMSRNDTWSWDGTNWTQLFPAHSPSPRAGCVMVATDAEILLLGGRDSAANFFADMWRWTGSDWELIDTGAISSRADYGIAYDEARDRVIVFGGREACGSGAFLGDTWEWDGDRWQRMAPAVSPPARERSNLSYDRARQRVVMFGGVGSVGTFEDMWEWDGADWIQLSPESLPPASSGHGMSFDDGRRLTVSFGTGGTWDYGPVNPGRIISRDTSAACAGSSGPITLTPSYSSGPWLGSPIELAISGAPAISIPIILYGFSDETFNGLPLPFPLFTFGSPTCELNISADIVEVAFPLPTPYVSGPLPSGPVLLGATLFVQGAFFDGVAPGTPLITSNYLEMVIGAK